MSMVAVTRRVTAEQDWPLYGVKASRHIEQTAQAALPPHTLMQRAGLAVAELALAIAPHAQRIWIACGPGNNGGDGLEAAIHLHRWGKKIALTWLGDPTHAPADSQLAWQRLQDARIHLSDAPPAEYDLAIDALLGLGCSRAPEGTMADWLARMVASPAPILQVDLASGLDTDHGVWHGRPMDTQAPRHTLSLLTLKPGLFTADGRDASGTIWFNDLSVSPTEAPDARLQRATHALPQRLHNSHKGRYGDVCVIGGASGMTGAAVLAAQAALHGGAGRVYLGLLDTATLPPISAAQASLMVRTVDALSLHESTVVCGCGGGDAVRTSLPRALSTAKQLVLDADGLTALQDTALWRLLQQRQKHEGITVLTPHPLEAARLLQCTVAQVQTRRLEAAQALADQTRSVVVLKGSGTVITAPGQTAIINATGNARLAVAGTGDVLAGLIGALLAQGMAPFPAACAAVARHGLIADQWPARQAFDAFRLSQHLS